MTPVHSHHSLTSFHTPQERREYGYNRGGLFQNHRLGQNKGAVITCQHPSYHTRSTWDSILTAVGTEQERNLACDFPPEQAPKQSSAHSRPLMRPTQATLLLHWYNLISYIYSYIISYVYLYHAVPLYSIRRRNRSIQLRPRQ